jgi:hypothetical protein
MPILFMATPSELTAARQMSAAAQRDASRVAPRIQFTAGMLASRPFLEHRLAVAYAADHPPEALAELERIPREE